MKIPIVCRETQVALMASRIRQTQFLVFKTVFPFVVKYAPKAVYAKSFDKTIAHAIYNLPILDGIGRVYGYK
ncbi:hypothetical protein ETF27_01750 [Prevotella brunnea]|uniref:Uncharacterized protein n=1 Tax=Prevotella brunnea TaxID=2508867 RepID=A0A5C8GMC0_9BACT|nr:hypothetical protein [Prevotella brunnea]TXJ63118.1 hypothetical protein ETF27_01750 [Prevotella brunnea]